MQLMLIGKEIPLFQCNVLVQLHGRSISLSPWAHGASWSQCLYFMVRLNQGYYRTEKCCGDYFSLLEVAAAKAFSMWMARASVVCARIMWGLSLSLSLLNPFGMQRSRLWWVRFEHKAPGQITRNDSRCRKGCSSSGGSSCRGARRRLSLREHD